MCWLCQASADGPLKFTDCSTGAAWRGTRRSHDSFLAEKAAKGEPVPVLLTHVKGLRLDCIMIDVMHTVDQGVASHIIGNIFFECISMRVWGGPNQEVNLKHLMTAMKQYYREHKDIDSKLQGTLTMERTRTSNGWPKLKGQGGGHPSPRTFRLGARPVVLGSQSGYRVPFALQIL